MAFVLRAQVLGRMWQEQPHWPPSSKPSDCPTDEHPAIVRSEVDGSQIGIATNLNQLRECSQERFDYDRGRRL